MREECWGGEASSPPPSSLLPAPSPQVSVTDRQPGVSDLHIHIQPWRPLKPSIADVMGFTFETSRFAAEYASACPERLLPFGGAHPRFTEAPEADWPSPGVNDLRQISINSWRYRCRAT